MRRRFIEDKFNDLATESKVFIEFNDEINGYIELKYFNKVKKQLTSHINGNKYVFFDEGYSIIEYLPLNKKYNCRAFFDNYNRCIGYYFDINNGSGELDGKHWYDDLWLDVILTTPFVNKSTNFISVDDEDEFEKAHEDGLVDDVLYKQGLEWMNDLIGELQRHENNLVNRSAYDIFRLKKNYGLPTDKF